jgi:hypothetical protein
MITPLPGATPMKPGSGAPLEDTSVAEGNWPSWYRKASAASQAGQSHLELQRTADHAASRFPAPPFPAATLPFFGVEPAILDDKGNEVEGVGQG